MTYDFDTVINRDGTYSLKWDIAAGELPMWVADMDFCTAPEITAAVQKRAEHGIFGYTNVPDEWYDAYIHHWKTLHNFEIKRDWLMFCTGVVPAISAIVRKLTSPAEKVIVQTPVYNAFFTSVLGSGRFLVENPLKYDGTDCSIDFADLEKKLSDPQVTLMILCNPQNPVGKIWSREILAHIGELCAKYSVVVLSDEIHCDITDIGKSYIPFASVSDICRDNSVSCISPSKAFNIAGLQTAAIFVPNAVLCHKVNRAINSDEIAEPNVFAVTAAIAAFTQGDEWLYQLREYIQSSKAIVRKFLPENIPEIRLVPSDATYLLWLDCTALTPDAEEFADFLRRKTGLYLTAGIHYGECGTGFVRMNIACPKTVLYDGLCRLKKGAEEFKKFRSVH